MRWQSLSSTAVARLAPRTAQTIAFPFPDLTLVSSCKATIRSTTLDYTRLYQLLYYQLAHYTNFPEPSPSQAQRVALYVFLKNQTKLLSPKGQFYYHSSYTKRGNSSLRKAARKVSDTTQHKPAPLTFLRGLTYKSREAVILGRHHVTFQTPYKEWGSSCLRKAARKFQTPQACPPYVPERSHVFGKQYGTLVSRDPVHDANLNVPIQCRGRFRYDPKSEIKTQTRSNAIYPEELLLSKVSKVEKNSNRIEWKKR